MAEQCEVAVGLPVVFVDAAEMENWLTASGETLLKTSASAALIFVAILVITRIAGLRTFAKMSSIDFATTIAIGSVLAAVVMNSDQSLLKGVVALATLVVVQAVFSMLKKHSGLVDRWATNKPVLLIENGKILRDNLDKARVSEEDLMAKLREANALSLSDVKAVVFETTGDMSVLHGSADKNLDDQILLGVADFPRHR